MKFGVWLLVLHNCRKIGQIGGGGSCWQKLAIADFDAFQALVESEESLGVDLLDRDALSRHPAFVLRPAEHEVPGL